jgi:hypothetical protein
MKGRRFIVVSIVLATIGLGVMAASGPSVRSMSADIQAMPLFGNAKILYGCGTGGESWGYRWPKHAPLDRLQKSLLQNGWTVKSRTPDETILICSRGALWPTCAAANLRFNPSNSELHVTFGVTKD